MNEMSVWSVGGDDNDKEEQKHCEEELSQCHFVHHNFHVNRLLIRTGKIEVLVQKPIPAPHCAPQIPHTSIQVFDSDAENRNTWREACPSDTLFTTNPKVTDVESNSGTAR
jgi:hypothetical protein